MSYPIFKKGDYVIRSYQDRGVGIVVCDSSSDPSDLSTRVQWGVMVHWLSDPYIRSYQYASMCHLRYATEDEIAMAILAQLA